MWNYIFFFYINSTERECKRESYSFYNVFKHYLLKIYVTSPTFVCVFKICICWNLFYSLRWDYLYMMTLNIDYIAINEMFFFKKEWSFRPFILSHITYPIRKSCLSNPFGSLKSYCPLIMSIPGEHWKTCETFINGVIISIDNMYFFLLSCWQIFLLSLVHEKKVSAKTLEWSLELWMKMKFVINSL